MIYGMPTLIENEDLDANAKLCKEVGFDFIELNMNFPQYQIEQLENISHLLKVAKEYDLSYTIHLDENMNICDFNRAVTNAYLKTVKRTIAVAKQIHAPIINMHMNHGIYITLPDRKVQLYETYNEWYMNDMRTFRALCEKEIGDAPILITIENTDGFRSYEKKAIEFLLESPVFGLTWDIGHSFVVEEKDVPFIKQHVKRLKHFHIHDADETHNHLMLGTGKNDVKARLDLAKNCGARCVIETKTIEALRGSSKWLAANFK